MNIRSDQPWCILASILCASLLSVEAAPAPELATSGDPAIAPPGTAGSDSEMPFISDDGRYVVFQSAAENLVRADNGGPLLLSVPGRMNLFLRDRLEHTTQLVSMNASGTGGGNENSTPLAISTGGQFALFESSATNLVPDDTNGVPDLFLRDIAAGATILVSAGTNGGFANRRCFDAVMSPDGRYVAFSSSANNLVPADANLIADVFVRDVQTRSTVLVSAGAQNGVPTEIRGSDHPRITPDGRYVAFLSTATNLVAGVGQAPEVYVRDLLVGTTRVVSTAAHDYIPGSIYTYNHAISADGRFITFQASASVSPSSSLIFRYDTEGGQTDVVASNAVPPTGFYKNFESLDMTPDGRFIAYVGLPAPASTDSCIYVWDASTAATTLVSADLTGGAPVDSTCELPQISASGGFVSFWSTATTLTTNPVSSDYHLFRRDLQARTTKLIDAGTNGAAATRTLLSGQSMTADGRYVAFDCADPDLVADDGNQAADVFVRDLVTDTTELVSARDEALPSQTGGPLNTSVKVSISADGRYLAFSGAAHDLLPNSYTNRYRGIFVRDLANGTNTLVSVDTKGLAGADGVCTQPVISGNGRYVAFTSYGSNLTPQDGSKTADVLVRDLQTGTTGLVSINNTGTGGGNDDSFSPIISTDGRYIMFLSWARDIGRGLWGTYNNLYLRDQVAGTNYSISSSSCYSAAMTPDGRYVAFVGNNSMFFYGSLYLWDSQAARIIYTNNALTIRTVAISPNGQSLAYDYNNVMWLWDRIANTNVSISGGLFGARPGMHFSADGRYFVYATTAANSARDTNGFQDVYLYDRVPGTNVLVSRSFDSGAAANGRSEGPDISADGRYVVYQSLASNIVSNDNNRVKDVFLYDRQAGTTVLLSASMYTGASANAQSVSPIFTGDGQTVVFHSAASDLVDNDFNQAADIFVVRLASTNPVTGFPGQIIYAPNLGQPPTIIWPAVPGKTYQVEYKNNLTDVGWQPLEGSVTLNGNQGTATDSAPASGHRFYRIVAH